MYGNPVALRVHSACAKPRGTPKSDAFCAPSWTSSRSYVSSSVGTPLTTLSSVSRTGAAEHADVSDGALDKQSAARTPCGDLTVDVHADVGVRVDPVLAGHVSHALDPLQSDQ